MSSSLYILLVIAFSCSCLSVTVKSSWRARHSHVDGVFWLPHVGVGGHVSLHGLVTVALLRIEIAEAFRARAVDLVLMELLQLMRRVAEHLVVLLGHLCLLGHGEASVKHVLVVLNEGSVATELVIESILRVRQNVSLVTRCGHVRLATVGLSSLVVLPQVRVEGALAVGGTVVSAEPTRVGRNVRVTTTAIVDVDDGLGVDGGQVVLWALLQERKGA